MSAIAYQEHMGAALVIIEKTTRIVHRCQVYELLYNRTTLAEADVAGLEEALVDLYCAVLQGLVRVGKFLAHRTLHRSVHAIFKPTETSNLLEDLRSYETEVMKEASICHDAQSSEQLQRLQGLLSLEKPILHIDENVEKVLEKIETQELIEVLDWISPVQYNSHHQLVSESRTKDTCDWVLGRPQFNQWRDETASVVLWLQGFGKGAFLPIHQAI